MISKNKWRNICKTNFEKSLDSRSFNFKLNEKKEMTQKVILKDAKDRHTMQLNGWIAAADLWKLFTTFKPCDYPFKPVDLDDEPMSLKNNALLKYSEKLPTYRMQIVDDYSFYLSLKVILWVTKFQPLYEKGIKYITELLKYFFNVDSDNLYDILNNQSSDEEKESSYSVENEASKNPNNKEKESQSQDNKFKDCLTFDDVENQPFLKLIELDWFRPSQNEEMSVANDDTILNTDWEMNGTPEEKAETEQFIPYFTKDYNVMFGSPNYIVFIRCFYTMYERLRLAFKIINDKVNEDYKENKDEVLHFYKNYIKAKERI